VPSLEDVYVEMKAILLRFALPPSSAVLLSQAHNRAPIIARSCYGSLGSSGICAPGRMRTRNTARYRAAHWPIWIWVFFLAPGPLTFNLFDRGEPDGTGSGSP